MAHSTTQLRKLWSEFECNEAAMVVVPFGPDKIRVAPPTAQAWQALAAVLQHHGYTIRLNDTDSYNCRTIKGTSQKSLHSYGIALDVNWQTNPFRDHPGKRNVRFSEKALQDERAQDVRLNIADTDMTPAMIEDVKKIITVTGKQAFEWGGGWATTKDAMHFEIDLSPEELEEGIDFNKVAGWQAFAADLGSGEGPALAHELVSEAAPPPGLAAIAATPGEAHVVIARSGLNLRADATVESAILRTLLPGTQVFVLGREGDWAQVDLLGDGLADGFVSRSFLRTTAPPPGVSPIGAAAAGAVSLAPAGDILDRIIPDAVKRMFPATPLTNITSNLPFVVAGLRSRGLADRAMALMALATIRAETEGFVPISEGRSKFNTNVTPFDRYDAGTPIGKRLGNTQVGDGPRFKGRGYVQLTGRDNYTRVGAQVGANLAADPDEANDPALAGLILAQFLKNKEAQVRTALAKDDLKTARKAVNGGSHGLDRFKDAYRRGEKALPT